MAHCAGMQLQMNGSDVYTLYIEAAVHAARSELPGNMRQRMRRAIDALAVEPRPVGSRILDTSALDLPAGVEIHRLRLDRWRLVYAIQETEQWVWILGLRRRPPYDYADLATLAQKLPT